MEKNSDDIERLEKQLVLLRGGWRHRWSWFRGERAYARLLRDCLIFAEELKFLEKRSVLAERAWLDASYRDLGQAATFLRHKDVEGGWACLHASKRYALYGLLPQELADRALILRAEAEKLSSWRAKAIDGLLSRELPLTPNCLAEATLLRDEHDSNQYHKIWLTADQLGLLTWSCAIGMLFLLPLVLYYHRQPFETIAKIYTQPDPSPWGFAMVCAVLVLGMFGGAFSVAQSIITDTSGAKIPERVANHWVTFIRALFGSVAGFAGYAFFRSRVVNIKIGEGGDSVAIALAVAFVFGYAGEKLILKVVESVGGSQHSKESPILGSKLKNNK